MGELILSRQGGVTNKLIKFVIHIIHNFQIYLFFIKFNNKNNITDDADMIIIKEIIQKLITSLTSSELITVIKWISDGCKEDSQNEYG